MLKLLLFAHCSLEHYLFVLFCLSFHWNASCHLLNCSPLTAAAAFGVSKMKVTAWLYEWFPLLDVFSPHLDHVGYFFTGNSVFWVFFRSQLGNARSPPRDVALQSFTLIQAVGGVSLHPPPELVRLKGNLLEMLPFSLGQLGSGLAVRFTDG